MALRCATLALFAVIACGSEDPAPVPAIPAPTQEVLLAPPDGMVALVLPAGYSPMPSSASRAMHERLQSLLPGARTTLYARVAPDGGIAGVLEVHEEVGEDEDGQLLESVLTEALAEVGAAYGDVEVQSSRDRDGRSIETTLTARFEDAEVWGRLRTWAEPERIEHRGCLCTGTACAVVRERCKLTPPEAGAPLDAPLRGPRVVLRVGDLSLSLPTSWTPVPEGALRLLQQEELAGYPRLEELKVVGRTGPDGGSAYLQVGMWCPKRSCRVDEIQSDVERSARAHAQTRGDEATVTRADGVLEIRIGTFSWERRHFSATKHGVREQACLCTGAGCRFVEAQCPVPRADASG